MKAPKTVFVCQECGSQSPKWVGRCGECGAWNSLVEERPEPEVAGGMAGPHRYALAGAAGAARLYSEIEIEQHARITTGIDEFDRVLGGGVVPGSLVLIGGEPGIGKTRAEAQALTAEVIESALGGLEPASKHAAALCVDGAKAIANSRSLASLVWLCVESDDVTVEGEALLRDRFGDALVCY
jgi:hypothetical protein